MAPDFWLDRRPKIFDRPQKLTRSEELVLRAVGRIVLDDEASNRWEPFSIGEIEPIEDPYSAVRLMTPRTTRDAVKALYRHRMLRVSPPADRLRGARGYVLTQTGIDRVNLLLSAGDVPVGPFRFAVSRLRSVRRTIQTAASGGLGLAVGTGVVLVIGAPIAVIGLGLAIGITGFVGTRAVVDARHAKTLISDRPEVAELAKREPKEVQRSRRTIALEVSPQYYELSPRQIDILSAIYGSHSRKPQPTPAGAAVTAGRSLFTRRLIELLEERFVMYDPETDGLSLSKEAQEIVVQAEEKGFVPRPPSMSHVVSEKNQKVLPPTRVGGAIARAMPPSVRKAEAAINQQPTSRILTGVQRSLILAIGEQRPPGQETNQLHLLIAESGMRISRAVRTASMLELYGFLEIKWHEEKSASGVPETVYNVSLTETGWKARTSIANAPALPTVSLFD